MKELSREEDAGACSRGTQMRVRLCVHLRVCGAVEVEESSSSSSSSSTVEVSIRRVSWLGV